MEELDLQFFFRAKMHGFDTGHMVMDMNGTEHLYSSGGVFLVSSGQYKSSNLKWKWLKEGTLVNWCWSWVAKAD